MAAGSWGAGSLSYYGADRNQRWASPPVRLFFGEEPALSAVEGTGHATVLVMLARSKAWATRQFILSLPKRSHTLGACSTIAASAGETS